jgi:cytochrome c553
MGPMEGLVMRLGLSNKGLLAALLLVLLALWSEAALAEGDYDKGARLSIYCAYCHGYDGNPLDASAPRLAGQPVDYIVARIKELQSSGTMHQSMLKAFLTGELDDNDIVNLATFYSRQPVRK